MRRCFRQLLNEPRWSSASKPTFLRLSGVFQVFCRHISRTVLSEAYRMLSREAIVGLRSAAARLDIQVRDTVKRLKCLRRGCRAGWHVQQRAARRAVTETVPVGKIPVISTYYRQFDASNTFKSERGSVPVLKELTINMSHSYRVCSQPIFAAVLLVPGS